MAPGENSAELARRLFAGTVGAALAGIALWSTPFALRFLVHAGSEGRATHTCTDSRGYHCPSGTESVLVALGFGVAGLAIVGLMVFASFGLLRRALGSHAPGSRVWVAAVAGPVLAVVEVFAVLMYGAWVGAFD